MMTTADKDGSGSSGRGRTRTDGQGTDGRTEAAAARLIFAPGTFLHSAEQVTEKERERKDARPTATDGASAKFRASVAVREPKE